MFALRQASNTVWIQPLFVLKCSLNMLKFDHSMIILFITLLILQYVVWHLVVFTVFNLKKDLNDNNDVLTR